ncbi:MAG: hypothetical protein EXR72_16120 [Myxococcales bacterium]|nr:hypothetical protein [Myxococcales bacterium]
MRALFWALIVASPAVARAGSLHGTIALPPAAPKGEARPLANWRVENGVLPIAPWPPDPSEQAIVVLEPAQPPEASKAHATVELKGLKLEPRLAVAQVGTTFDFKNDDLSPRTLYLKGVEGFMPAEATAPGATRSVRFAATGIWQVRDREHAHAATTLVVVATPHFTRADEKGDFRIEAPDGKYTLKVFYRGAWAATQPVEVSRGAEVSVKLAPAPSVANQ